MREWVREARCAGDEIKVDPKEFQLPLRGDSQSRAKLECLECPVRLQCLAWALDNKEIWGVWGGLDEAEIRRCLSVDALGKTLKRCRPPGCPNSKCKAKPESLKVDQRSRRSRLTCTECGFSWVSQSSAQAVMTYLRSRQLKKLRASTTRRAMRLEDRKIKTPEVLPGIDTPLPLTRDQTALVAGGESTACSQ